MSRADEFRAAIARTHSVVHAIDAWCEAHGIGAGPVRSDVHTHADAADVPSDFPIPLGPDEAVRYRSLTLRRGAVALVEARNWFLPDRLPPETRRALEESDTPFGMALRPGRISRRTTAFLVPPDAASVGGVTARVSRDVPLLTVRGTVMLDAREVAFVEERFERVLVAG